MAASTPFINQVQFSDDESSSAELSNDEFDAQEVLEINETFVPNVLSNGNRPLMTEVIEVSTVLPEYPQSHVSGYTYIIPCNPQKPLDYRDIMHGVQYPGRFRTKNHATCPYLGVDVQRYRYACSGVKLCSNLPSELKNLHHTKVTEETWGKIQEVRRLIEMAGDDERRKNALGIYIGEQRLFKQKKACRVPNTTCRPVFGWSMEPNIAGIYHPYISCIHRKPLPAHIQPDHYFKSLSFRTDTDLVLLGQYFNQAVQPDLTQCGAIESTGSRKAECNTCLPHGELISEKCQVAFNIIIPEDIQKCPYFLFTSHGIHTHPPPPPTKTPLDILEELRRIIQDIKDPDMTTGSFLCNPQIIEYCNERNAERLSGLRATLVTQDRIKSLIDKEKIALFPKGQEVNGLIFQCQREPKLREYVQHTFQDNENTLIILAHQAQFKLLQSLKMFEVDMNYKRLRRKDLNEIVFAAFLPLHGKVVTLCRAFTNRQDADGYEDLFQKVFELMEKHTDQPACFHYLHGSGFESITLDMDEGQMLGLGQYLSSIDPERRPARWHIPHIMITCRVHFFRGIEKAIGQRKRGTTAFQTMASLLNCETQLDYYEIIQLLQGYEDEAIMHWASYKADPLIAGGLNKACSSMDSSFFDNARMHTNAGEQSHNKIYVFGGTWLSILKAAQCARICDARDIDQYNARQDLGIQHSYQSDSIPSQRSRKSLREEKKRRRKFSESTTSDGQRDTQYPRLTIESDEISIRVSSSGSPQPRRTQSRGRGRSRRGSTRQNSSSPAAQAATHNRVNQSLDQQERELRLRLLRAQVERVEIENRMMSQGVFVPPQNQSTTSPQLVSNHAFFQSPRPPFHSFSPSPTQFPPPR